MAVAMFAAIAQALEAADTSKEREMKTGLVSCAVLLASAGAAMGSLQTIEGPISYSGTRYQLSRVGHLQEVPSFASTREPIMDIYDNTVTPLAFGGNGTNFLGDELQTTGIGDIREFEFSVGNAGTGAGTLTRIDISIQFWEDDLGGNGPADYTFLGQLDFNDVALNLAAGTFTSLVLTDPGISLSQQTVVALVRLHDPVGTGPANLFQVRADPPAVGTSANDIAVGNATGFTGFAAFPSSNNLWYRVAVPAPGSLALLGLGGLVAVRRRR